MSKSYNPFSDKNEEISKSMKGKHNSTLTEFKKGQFKGKTYTHTFSECPRHKAGYKSGQGLEICPASHAELNVLIEAARLGTKIEGCKLYLSGPNPCRECSKAIVNAGIIEVIYKDNIAYPDIGLSGKTILETCGVKVRLI